MKKGKLVRLSKSANYRPGHGTTVTVYDLFHSSPVRKKCFNECLELEWIKLRMEAFALMHFAVSFSLLNDATGTLILQTHKSNSIIGAFAHLFGMDNPQELHKVSCEGDMFKVNGYVGRKIHPNRNAQFIFVNKRLTLKTELHTLINRVLSESIVLKQPLEECHGAALHQTVDKHDIYIIMISCPLSEYEITFNPRKTLLEFKHSDALMKCVRNCLWKFSHKDDIVPANFTDSSLDDSNAFSPDDTDVTSSDAGTRSYGKSINPCNICNNLQSITVRRAGVNYTEDVFDPTMFGAQNETESHGSSNSCHGHRTAADPVSSAAFHSMGRQQLERLVCDNNETTSERNMDVVGNKIDVENTGSRCTSVETSDYRNRILTADGHSYRSERSGPTTSHPGMTQHSVNGCDLRVGEINSNTDLPETFNDHQIHMSHTGTNNQKHNMNTGINETEIERPGIKSIGLIKTSHSDDNAIEKCSDDVIFRDPITLQSQNSYSSMTCLKDTIEHSKSFGRASVQLAPLKKLKRRMTEDPSSLCSNHDSSLKSFKRNISNKNRHELLGGLTHVREQLSMPNRQCAQDHKLNLEKKLLHDDDGTRAAEIRYNDLVKRHTSTTDKCAEQIDQSGRSTCESDNTSRLSMPQTMCRGLPEQDPSDQNRFNIVLSSDTRNISQNNPPCKRKTLVDITSNMSKMIKYNHFSKRGSERWLNQNIDHCERLAQVDRFVSDDWRAESSDQVKVDHSNCCRRDGKGTLTTNAEDMDVLSKTQDRSGAAGHPKSFMTSENLLSCAQFGNCGEVVGNLKSNVAKHLEVLEQELDVSERATFDDGRIVSSCDNELVSTEDVNDHLGARESNAVFRGCCSEDSGEFLCDSNGFVHEELNRNVGSYHENHVADNTTTIHEMIPYVGTPDKTQCRSIENRLISDPNCSQRMEMFRDQGSTDDRKERTQVTSDQLVLQRNSAMIICNSVYDVEFVPLTDVVDASDLESTADDGQKNAMDVDMSPRIHNCSQESGGFEISVLTDTLSPSIGEQHDHPVGIAGLTQECTASKHSADSGHAANVCSETVIETQSFEVTEMEPTELEDCYRATIPTYDVSATQTAECKQVNIMIVNVWLVALQV